MKIVDIFATGMFLILIIMIRPELPKEGYWQILHSKEELAEYNEAKKLAEQINQLQKDIKDHYGA